MSAPELRRSGLQIVNLLDVSKSMESVTRRRQKVSSAYATWVMFMQIINLLDVSKSMEIRTRRRQKSLLLMRPVSS